VGCLTVDNTPIPTDSTPMDSLDLSHVTVQSISNRRFSIPIKVETVENTEEITALIDSGAEGLFIDKSIAHKWRTSILKSPIKVRNVDGTYNENGAITERCLIPFRINDKIMTEWFYVTALGDQNLILGLPWLEKHNPIIDWTEKTLEFRNSQEDKAKAFIRSLAQEQEETMLIEDKDLVVWYLKSHRGPEPSDQLYTPFEDIRQWNEEQPDIAIRKYSPAQQMEHKYNAKQEESILPTQYLPWKEVFEQKAAEQFPGKRPWDHAIELRDNFKPKKGKIYPLNPLQQNTLDEWIKEQLAKGYIRPLKSPQASPFFFVEKKDAKKLRPCQDYRYLNEFTKPNAYPLPLISDLMITLKGSKFFTKLDIRWGYNNVRIKEGDEWKAAFITNKGLFEPTVMFFGLRNSPATFQAMMDDYFRDMIDEGWIAIYMDDILIHAKTKEDLEKRTKRVLERLKEHNLYLKPEKCKFERTEVEFLGTIISENTIRMDPIKLAGIRDWPSPTTVKQTRSFLGFGNYYRRFISGFAEIARPLHELTKKDKIWNWTNECQTAFETLKECFSTAPVLTMPDTTKPFILETDASKWAIGATLLQKQEDGQLHPCGYLSHALTQTERNWQIYDRELYGIIYALDEWKYLLLGGEHTLTIHCDHKNLTYYRTPQRLTARQARWWTNLSRYNYQLIHIPGAKLIQADTLSRRPDHTKAAFITNKGLFEPTVMFFGLRNSPATFQAMMDDYFRDMIDEGWIAIYMDDILIHAKTKEDLEKRTKRVLERLKEHDLYLKPEKCKFERTEVEFLGTIISENTIQMDPIKLAGIRDWPSPTTVKQTRSFLGFGNYYRRFISGFAEIA
jgi:hypothetical protein